MKNFIFSETQYFAIRFIFLYVYFEGKLLPIFFEIIVLKWKQRKWVISIHQNMHSVALFSFNQGKVHDLKEANLFWTKVENFRMSFCWRKNCVKFNIRLQYAKGM